MSDKWTVEALKEYIDMRLDELEKSIDRRFSGQYSVGGRILGILGGGAALVAIIAAIVRFNL